MVWGTLAKGYPICYAHTKLMEPRTSQAVLSSFLNHIPLSASFLPKYVPLKYVCIYVMCINYKTHIPQTLKINAIKINKHSNIVLCISTRWSYTHSSVPNFVDHCSRGDVVKSGIWAKQNPGLVQNLLGWVLSFMKFSIPLCLEMHCKYCKHVSSQLIFF